MQMIYTLFLPPLCLWRHRSKLWLTLQKTNWKCEVIAFGKSENKTVQSLSVDRISSSLPVRNAWGEICAWVTCGSHISLCNNLRVDSKTFSSFGSIHAFQGILSPVSTSSIVQQCVLLYGVENWIMSTESLKRLVFSRENCQKNSQATKLVFQYCCLYCSCLELDSLHLYRQEVEIPPLSDNKCRQHLLQNIFYPYWWCGSSEFGVWV